MNVRERIGRLENLLQRIQTHARARRAGKARAVDAAESQSFSSEPPTATLEVVDRAPLEAIESEDIVEMSSDVLESVPPSAVEPIEPVPPMPAAARAPSFDEDAIAAAFGDDAEPPASSKRARIPDTIDHAVAQAEREAVLIDDGREVPLKTPPPESGPQEAPAPAAALAAPPAPDFDQLLDDLPPLSHEARRLGPSPEQLGETIDLEEAVGPTIELEPERPFTPAPLVSEELEVTLPFGRYAGNYDEALVPPPEAREELEEHRRRSGEHVSIREADARALHPASEALTEAVLSPQLGSTEAATPEGSTHAVSSHPPSWTDAAALPQGSKDVVPSDQHVATEVVQRSSLAGLSAVEFTGVSAHAQTPATFLMLLDESLRLGDD